MTIGFSVASVIEALLAQPPRGSGDGRALMLIAARRGEGVTSAACAVAEAAGPRATYAIDLDLRRNALARCYAGRLGPRIDGRLNGALFYDIVGPRGAIAAAPTTYFFHRVARSRLFVGAFAENAMPEGGRVRLSPHVAFWNAARAGGATVIVDSPALARSALGLRVARHMDGVVLVVGADEGAAPAALAAKSQLLAAGANLIGLVYSGASESALRIERLLRHAG